MDDHAAVDRREGSWAGWLVAFLVGLGSGAGLWVMWHKVMEERAAAARGQKVAVELGERLASLQVSAADMRTKLAAAQDEASAFRSRVDELSSEVREKDSEIQKLKSTYAALEDQLNAEIKKGEISLSQVGGRIQVDVVDKILFDSGKAELSGRGMEVLSRVGAILTDIGDRQIQVSGHTDDSPIAEPLRASFASNWELSASRAVNVVRYLAESAKVPAKRLVAAGYGQFHPIADNADAAGRARNRRIEILLTPTLNGRPAAAAAANPAVAKPEKPDPKAANAGAGKASAAKPLGKKK